MVFLVQTDTTAGFLSSDPRSLNAIKNRHLDKPCILCAATFKEIGVRVPNRHKKLVRNAKTTTFISQNSQGFRVVKDGAHKKFLLKFGALYSTSANLNTKAFDLEFAKKQADIIVEDWRGFYESKPSTILKLRRKTLKKIR